MRSQSRRAPRRGTLYISVLGTAMLVSVAGLCALHVARTELRAASSSHETAAARAAADAGVELALEQVRRFSDWRTRFTARELQPEAPLGEARFSYLFDAGVENDGDAVALDADGVDEITVRGFGYAGGSVSVAEVTLTATAPLESLNASIATESNLLLDNGNKDLTVSYAAFSGANIDTATPSSQIIGDASAVGSISPGAVTGNSTPNAPERPFPDPVEVFNHYLARGARIDINDLPVSSGRRQFLGQALTPTYNPFGGATNPDGIYVIDCQGQGLEIRNSRIIGTLVLIDNDDDSRTSGSIAWRSYVSNLPSLMVENKFTFGHDESTLTETFIGRSLNPQGAPSPYSPTGIDHDSDLLDSYTPELTGLVYVGDKLTFETEIPATLTGAVVCKEAEVLKSFQIDYRSVHYDQPPPGFRTSSPSDTMAIQIGSWRRGEAPAP